VASSKDRERKLARAKIERQQARRAEQARRKRVIQARVAAGVSLLFIFVIVSWSFDWYGVFKTTKKVDASGCVWHTKGVANSSTVATGTPPLLKTKTTGSRDMTIKLNSGEVDAQLDATNAPCATESFTYLAGRGFFNNTQCHRLTTAGSGIYVLQCGDPSGTGSGGASYQFDDENLPTDFTPAPAPSASPGASASPSGQVIYPAGTIAMANSGPDTNGSQFFIVYKDTPFSPDYAVVGKVTKGLDVIQKIAKDGVQPSSDGTAQVDGKPKDTVTIQALTVANPSATPAASPSGPSSAPAPSGSPTSTPQS
jgi:peptidyl-prolyl cis-trans isomerase B (cyclophilin B)